MRYELRTLLLAAIAAWGSSACSPSEAGRAAPHESEDAAAKPSVEPATTGEVGETGETADAEVVDIEDDVIEIEGPEAKRGRNMVPVEPINLLDANVRWTEHQRLPDPNLELVAVASGVLARSPSGVYTLRDAELVLNPQVTLPTKPLLGHWPQDVWYLDSTNADVDADGRQRYRYEVFQLDRKLQWVAQALGRASRFDADAVRKGWFAGLLVRDGSTLTRLGSRKDAPKVGLRMGKVVLDTFETSSGRLYNISLRPNGVYVQQACFNQACVEDNAKKLPFGSDWTFTTQIPRQRHSLSVLASVKVDGAVSHQLLHYEVGGWSLETLVHEPSGMWPTADGGLWLLVRDELRYRTSKGDWYAIAGPKGASKLSVALDSDLATLWIAAKVGGETVVFTTKASPAELPEPKP